MKTFIWLVFVIYAFCVGVYFNTAHDLPLPIALIMMLICGGLMGKGFNAFVEEME